MDAQARGKPLFSMKDTLPISGRRLGRDRTTVAKVRALIRVSRYSPSLSESSVTEFMWSLLEPTAPLWASLPCQEDGEQIGLGASCPVEIEIGTANAVPPRGSAEPRFTPGDARRFSSAFKTRVHHVRLAWSALEHPVAIVPFPCYRGGGGVQWCSSVAMRTFCAARTERAQPVISVAYDPRSDRAFAG